MSILKAITHLIADIGNDALTKQQQKAAKNKAYHRVGKDIEIANKKGFTINGKYRYKKYLSEENQKTNNSHRKRRNFIDDLFK